MRTADAVKERSRKVKQNNRDCQFSLTQSRRLHLTPNDPNSLETKCSDEFNRGAEAMRPNKSDH